MQQQDVTEFKGQLRGDLIEPTDARYDHERKVYNAMIDRKPRLIAKCADVADVVAAVQFGRKHDLRVSIRGGGHNAGGLGVRDNGWVDKIVPDFDYFGLGSAAINAQLGKDFWQNGTDLASADFPAFLQRGQICAAKLRESTFTWRGFTWTEGREVAIGERRHGG